MIFRVAETERMPNLVGSVSEPWCGKPMNRNGFSKPKSEPLPKPELPWCQVRRVRRVKLQFFCGYTGETR